jgi:hypothetical protein
MKRIAVVAALLASSLAGCGQKEEPYQAKAAYSGKKPSLPAVPTLPNKNRKEGDAYTVWGASHDLRSVVHHADFADKEISIVGWVVKTNYADAPECAVHKVGKADPVDCKAPVPTFWIADGKEEKSETIAVMGWASNYAQIYTMIEEIDKKEDEAKHQDIFFGHELVNPLPNVGGKVRVTGRYGVTYTKHTGGAASNPKWGIMTVGKIEWIEKPPEPAVLPGMKIRKKK